MESATPRNAFTDDGSEISVSYTPVDTPVDAPASPPAPKRYLTVEESIENAPNDLKEKDVDDVFPDADGVTGSVRIRALTAAQGSRVMQSSLDQRGQNAKVQFGELERLRFQLGVIKPKYTAEEVRTLHLKSGPSFSKVLKEITELSGITDASLKKAEEDFQEPDE